MKKKALGIIALMLVTVMTLSGCQLINNVRDFFMDIFNPKVELTDQALATEKLIDFKDGANPDVLFESDGWTNGDVFNVVWKKSNVKYENGIMILGITEEKASAWLNDAEVEFNYTAGEARTQNYFGYGDFEVSMKPSANPGTASTFFTCTGPYDIKYALDENGDFLLDGDGQRIGVENPHDEIDIEFLGSDTTHVQFNFFVDGVGGNEYMHDLGFDASEAFHTYGYRWEPDSITWFVDGVPVYKVTTDTSVKEAGNVRIVEKLPSTPGRILTNYWCGTERAEGWMGKYKGAIKDQGTQYQWIAASAEGAPLNPSAKPPVGGDDTEIDWSKIDAIAPTFETTPEYIVAIDGNKANVTYTDINGSAYKPVEMDVTEAVAGKNYVYMKVTNNGTETVNVRVNMFDPTLTGDNKATNLSATMNGTEVFTDLTWGGSFFDITAGETAELVVCFGVGGTKLQLMIDSSRNDAVLRSGDVTVEDIKFAAVGEVEIPHSCEDADADGKCDGCGEDMPIPPEPVPEDPVSGNLTLDFGGFTTNIGGNVTDGYGVDVDGNNNIYVKYTNIVGNSYKNIWADVSAIAGTKTTFTVKVTNNGDAAVKVRIDIESLANTSANTTCCNVSATKDGVGVFTDTEWGGSMFEIAAGATATLEVVYNPVHKPTNVKIMIDSCQWDDSTSHAGEVVFSDIAFSGEYTPDVGGDDPDPTPDTGLQLDFWASDPSLYTVSGNNIKYNGTGSTYACVGYNVSALAAGKNTFTVTVTNNGTADVRVRFDIQGTTQVGNHKVLNTNAVGGDVWTDMEWGGSAVTVAAGQSVTLVISYDENTERGAVADLVIFVDAARGDSNAYSSDITLSGMAFSKVGGEEPGPDTPVAEGEYLSFTANDCYTLSATPSEYVNSVDVSYTAVSDNTYQNVNTWIQDKAAGKATLNLTVKNNGAETVTITVKLENSAGGAAETKVVINAGESITATLAYSFAPDLLYFFIDSDWSETTATHAGNVTISGIYFS